MAEREAHTVIARVYAQSGERLLAVEHAILAGDSKLAKESAPQEGVWPEFLAKMVVSKAPWVREAAYESLELHGDFAPDEVARGLVPKLLDSLGQDADDLRMMPTSLKALAAIVLEATDEQLDLLMPILEGAAARKPGMYRLTDPGVMILAARLYQFRPAFRQRAAAILGEMALGSHTGEFSRALRECGDDRSDLVEAFDRVAGRENADLAGPMSELTSNAATRALWSRRLQFVEDHPVGRRAKHTLGARYEIPSVFLEEQDVSVIQRYVDKLVAIGSNQDEMNINRQASLFAAGDVIDLLAADERRRLFSCVRPMTDPAVQISEADQYHSRSQHPLSRARISLGSSANVRAAAGWLLGRAATDRDQRAPVVDMAIEWIRSDNKTLQDSAASLLTLPNLSSNKVQIAELVNHNNHAVRRAVLSMPAALASSNSTLLERLARDPDRAVRVHLARLLPSVKSVEPDSYERIRTRLGADSSSIVRAIVAQVGA